jgi:lysophospholipase L1-like esterase
MTFDIGAIPVGSTINSIVFNGYVNATNWPYWNINPVATDPMNTVPSVLYNDIIAEANAGFYLFREEPAGYTTGWKTHTLGGNANTDMEAALAQGWFAIGIIDRDFDESSYYIHFDGWNEANPPFLIVNYSWTLPQFWLTIDGGTSTSGSVPSLDDYDLTIGFDAAGLAEGIYSANILINSNDPLQAEVSIPVTLNVVSGMEAELKIWLEGPFAGSNMHTVLNQSGLLPLTQPYAIDPWNYGGTESVAAIPNPDVVDWFLVEFYDSLGFNQQNLIEAKACFLLSDGRLVDLDGSSPLWLNASSGGDLYALLRHRNHLDVMSASPLPGIGNLYQLDFTTGENTVFGGSAGFKELAPGMWGMVAGDADADGQITMTDKTGFFGSQSGASGYLQADHNLDGEVNNQDKNDLWLPNFIGGYSAYGAYDTILVDFGGTSHMSPYPWNNLTGFINGTISNLFNTNGLTTPSGIAIADDFVNINCKGSLAPDPALGIPDNASSGSYSDQSDAVFTISNIQNTINIVILGSSTAAGVGPDNPDSAWVSRFEHALKQVNPDYEVINLAVSGYTTFQILPTGYPVPPGISETIDVNRNITAALAYEPLAVIVNMPSNDAFKYYPVRQQLDNFNAVREAAALEEVPVWFTTSQPRNFTDPAQIAIQVALADTIQRVYGSYSIDFWTGIADQDGYVLPDYDSEDGIHLNNEAHGILFDRVWGKQIGPEN